MQTTKHGPWHVSVLLIVYTSCTCCYSPETIYFWIFCIFISLTYFLVLVESKHLIICSLYLTVSSLPWPHLIGECSSGLNILSPWTEGRLEPLYFCSILNSRLSTLTMVYCYPNMALAVLTCAVSGSVPVSLFVMRRQHYELWDVGALHASTGDLSILETLISKKCTNVVCIV